MIEHVKYMYGLVSYSVLLYYINIILRLYLVQFILPLKQ